MEKAKPISKKPPQKIDSLRSDLSRKTRIKQVDNRFCIQRKSFFCWDTLGNFEYNGVGGYPRHRSIWYDTLDEALWYANDYIEHTIKEKSNPKVKYYNVSGKILYS